MNAYTIAAKIIYEQAMKKYPNPADDKKRHCYASCLLNKWTLWTFLPSLVTGAGFEGLQGIFGGHASKDDIEANIYGIIVSYSGDCGTECNQCPVQ